MCTQLISLGVLGCFNVNSMSDAVSDDVEGLKSPCDGNYAQQSVALGLVPGVDAKSVAEGWDVNDDAAPIHLQVQNRF
jgi:hypothetical protein